MSLQETVARVEALRQALANPAELLGGQPVASTGGTAAPTAGEAAPATFASALQQASASYGQGAAGVALGSAGSAYAPAGAQSIGAYPPVGGAGPRIVAIAESQLGQAEQPPGSNESPAIAEYRTATEGASPGAPWCAYFASWVARQAGEPLGEHGQGLGAVSEIWSWAQSTGRAVPNGPGVVPKPGDLIVFGDEHVGIVRGVRADGSIETIEGNYENKVAANVRTASEATGYVSMG